MKTIGGIVKVKRSSWHYKISHVGDTIESGIDNLCFYFWRLVWKLILVLSAIIIVPSMCYIVIYTYITSHFIISNSIMMIFIISCATLPPVVIYFIRIKIGEPLKTQGENIVFEFIKAKKNKICPLIEYVD